MFWFRKKQLHLNKQFAHNFVKGSNKTIHRSLLMPLVVLLREDFGVQPTVTLLKHYTEILKYNPPNLMFSKHLVFPVPESGCWREHQDTSECFSAAGSGVHQCSRAPPIGCGHHGKSPWPRGSCLPATQGQAGLAAHGKGSEVVVRTSYMSEK